MDTCKLCNQVCNKSENFKPWGHPSHCKGPNHSPRCIQELPGPARIYPETSQELSKTSQTVKNHAPVQALIKALSVMTSGTAPRRCSAPAPVRRCDPDRRCRCPPVRRCAPGRRWRCHARCTPTRTTRCSVGRGASAVTAGRTRAWRTPRARCAGCAHLLGTCAVARAACAPGGPHRPHARETTQPRRKHFF